MYHSLHNTILKNNMLLFHNNQQQQQQQQQQICQPGYLQEWLIKQERVGWGLTGELSGEWGDLELSSPISLMSAFAHCPFGQLGNCSIVQFSLISDLSPTTSQISRLSKLWNFPSFQFPHAPCWNFPCLNLPVFQSVIFSKSMVFLSFLHFQIFAQFLKNISFLHLPNCQSVDCWMLLKFKVSLFANFQIYCFPFFLACIS